MAHVPRSSRGYDGWVAMQPLSPPMRGEVRVWIARVSEHAPRTGAFAALLDRREVAQAARYRFASDRIRYVVAHGLVRVVLGAAAGCRPHDVAFHFGEFGKPALDDAQRCEPLEFNLSHAGDRILIATALRPVGVDIEERRAARPDDPLTIVAWTRLEAYVKALGTGLTSTAVEFDEAAWSLAPLDVGPEYAAAVVAAGHDWVVNACRLTPELLMRAA